MNRTQNTLMLQILTEDDIYSNKILFCVVQ